MSESPYLMNNEHPETGATIRRAGTDPRSDLDRSPEPGRGPAGARCLEIGTGGGSIARWLAGAGRADRARGGGRSRHPMVPARRQPAARGAGAGRREPDRSRRARGISSTNGSCCSTSPPGSMCSITRSPGSLRAAGWCWRTSTPARSARPIGPDPTTSSSFAWRPRSTSLLGERDGANNFAADAWRHLRRAWAGRDRRQRPRRVRPWRRRVHPGDGGERPPGPATVSLRLGINAEDIDRFLEVLADPDTIIGTSVLITAWGRRPA